MLSEPSPPFILFFTLFSLFLERSMKKALAANMTKLMATVIIISTVDESSRRKGR